MALAAVGSKPSSRTALMRSRISALTSLTSLSAFAVPALEAILRRFSAFLGSWDQQRVSGPLAGSVQRSPFAFVALHWFICGLPFYRGWGDGLGLNNTQNARCRSPKEGGAP